MFKELTFEQKIGFLYYLGKIVMCIYFGAESLPSYDDRYKLIKVTEETFSLNKKLWKLGLCANYMQDRDHKEGVSLSITYVNHSPNRRQTMFVEHEPCKCYFCRIHEDLHTELSSGN